MYVNFYSFKLKNANIEFIKLLRIPIAHEYDLQTNIREKKFQQNLDFLGATFIFIGK